MVETNVIDAVVAGHLCVDIIPEISAETAASDSFLVPGRLAEVGGVTLSTGGSVSNTGLALHRLGMNVRLVARIGADAIGSLTRDLLAAHDALLVRHLSVGVGEPSSYTLVINPPGTDRSFLHCPGTNNTFGPDDVPGELLLKARLFHLGYPPLMRRMFADGGVELTTIFQRAKAAGVTTSLDMAMPDPAQPSGRADWAAILARVLPYVDVFLPSMEELLYMLRRPRYEAVSHGPGDPIDRLAPQEMSDVAAEALRLGCKIVVLKLGHRGCYLRTAADLGDLGRGAPADISAWRGRELWAPCFRVQVVGTTGAGDATIAGFIAGMLRGQSAEEAVTSAVAVGACNVEAADATSGVRGWTETQERIRSSWDRLDAGVASEGWLWDGEAAL